MRPGIELSQFLRISYLLFQFNVKIFGNKLRRVKTVHCITLCKLATFILEFDML